MWELKIIHHAKDWRNGDLEDKLELVDKQLFKTKTSAKEYIMSQVKGKQIEQSWKTGKEISHVIYFTGVTWQHENSGEQMEEYYDYSLTQIKLK